MNQKLKNFSSNQKSRHLTCSLFIVVTIALIFKIKLLLLILIMGFALKISPLLLKSIASLYSDPHMVPHEYISNSIDAAEIFYNKDSNSYSRPIEISITIDGKSYDYAWIIIEDNCTGIPNLSDLVTKIGNSSKRDDDNTAGHFAFGIYSFLALCDKLTIITRLSGSKKADRIELNAKMFDESKVIEEQFNIHSFEISDTRDDCWTRIKLEDFNKEAFKELSAKSIKEAIENQFELILKRKGISIKVVKKIGDKIDEYICHPFNYDKYEGEVYQKELKELEKFKSKKFKSKEIIPLLSPVKVFLKVSKGRALNRKPVFVIKGRRITDISNVSVFRTISKGTVWSHPNVTGYIDVTGVLEPKISRDDFKADIKGKALFHTLNLLEDEIKEFISSQLKLPTSSEYKNLEKFLSDTLQKLTEHKRFRKILNYEKGSSINCENKGRGNAKEEIRLNVPKKIESIGDSSTLTSEGFGSSNLSKNDISDTQSPAVNKKDIEIKEVVVKITKKARQSKEEGEENYDDKRDKTAGIKINIDCYSEPFLDENNNKLRSMMIDKSIIIYKKHPMFEERTRRNIHGVQTISSELIYYVAMEIMTQIKSLVFDENRENINDILPFLRDLGEGTYLFITELSKLEGKNLSDLTRL